MNFAYYPMIQPVVANRFGHKDDNSHHKVIWYNYGTITANNGGAARVKLRKALNTQGKDWTSLDIEHRGGNNYFCKYRLSTDN